MRLKYYLLSLKKIKRMNKLRQMNIKKSFVLFVFLLVFVFLTLILVCKKCVEPTIKKLCEENAALMARSASNNAVLNNVKDINYEDLVSIKQDNNTKVNVISVNTMLINKIVNSVTMAIDEEFETYTSNYIKIPLSSFFGVNFFAGSSIKIKTKTILIGDVSCEVKSSFESVGINQTKHRIYIEVKNSVETIAPLVSTKQEYVNTIMIAETVIVGDIPQTYYNLEGIEDFSSKDSLSTTN